MSEDDKKVESLKDNIKTDKIEEILENLNLPITNKDESLKENQKKLEENSELKYNKYVKKYKGSDSRLYGIAFQNSIESNIINIAVSSLNISENNNIKILSFQQDDLEEDEEDNTETNLNTINNSENASIKLKDEVKIDFPVSSLLFSPHEINKNLLISTSDILNVYSYEKEKLKLIATCEKNNMEKRGPITSCDWSLANNAIIGSSSVDHTVSIWDLNIFKEKHTIIAHDKEVFDIALGPDEFTFITTGADGSVRLFDLRQPDSSSIFFETRDESPILRLKWNMVNPNFILTVIVDKNEIYILDIRKLGEPYAILKEHTNVVNNAIWAPKSNTNLISVSDDKTALLWDINCGSNKSVESIMKYEADNEIENVAWGEVTQNWIGIIEGNETEILRIQ